MPLSLYVDGAAALNSTLNVGAGADLGTVGGYLAVGVNAGNTGTINQTGGAVAAYVGFELSESSGSHGYYNLSGGSLALVGTSPTSVGVRDSAEMTVSGDATFTVSGVGETQPFCIGGLSLLGGTILLGSGTSTFTQSGGEVWLLSTIPALHLGCGSDATGIYNLEGGTLKLDTDIVNLAGTGYLKVNGGTLNFGGDTVDVDYLEVGTKDGATGELDITSGKTFLASLLTVGAGTGSGTVDVLGGTVQLGDLLFGGATSAVRLDMGQSIHVLQSNYSVSDALADISAGHVVNYIEGGLVQVSTVDIGGVNYTQLMGTIPEPGTIAMLVSSVLGLLAYAWRKRK